MTTLKIKTVCSGTLTVQDVEQLSITKGLGYCSGELVYYTLHLNKLTGKTATTPDGCLIGTVALAPRYHRHAI